MVSVKTLFEMLVFPGLLFLLVFGMVFEYVDRKFHARLQNRVGPPWYQPLADLIKLFAKEHLIPDGVERTMFTLLPVIALTSVVTSAFYIPLIGKPLFSFKGDVIMVLYLLTIPTLTFFLAGWFSLGPYSLVGAMRGMTQLFAFEVPLFIGVLSPFLLAGTWSFPEMTAYYQIHPFYILFNLIGFVIAVVALLGKLEKTPFDSPEAETEIVAGSFTEYSGLLLGLFRMAVSVEMVVGASLLAAIFFPFWSTNLLIAVSLYLLKVTIIVLLLSYLRTIFARLRIDQLVNMSWRYAAPLGFLQILITIIVKGTVL